MASEHGLLDSFRLTWHPELMAWEVYTNAGQQEPIYIREDRGTNTPGSFKEAQRIWHEAIEHRERLSREAQHADSA